MNVNLCKLVETTGESCEALAPLIGIPPSTLRAYTNGNRAVGTKHAKVLAEYFNVTPQYIRDKESAPVETDKSAAMMLDLFNQLTPEEKLDVTAHAAEIVRNHKDR